MSYSPTCYYFKGVTGKGLWKKWQLSWVLKDKQVFNTQEQKGDVSKQRGVGRDNQAESQKGEQVMDLMKRQRNGVRPERGFWPRG